MRLGNGAVYVLGLALVGGLAASAQVSRSAMDTQIAEHLRTEFASQKKLANLQPTVEDQIVTLTGTVPDYRAKLEALRAARQVESANGVIDRIRVAGVTVPDQELKEKIATRLTYDRMGMGQTFNALTVAVHNGHVVVGGEVRDYPARDSAVDIVADTKGVKGVTDTIKVAPLSPMDDQIRLAAAQRIYGNMSLKRYANNPAHTIRILVNNGRVTLVGVVDTQVDKSVAGNAVSTIPGVFGVTNDLVVSH